MLLIQRSLVGNQTYQPCGGWKTCDNRVHHLADPINRRGRWPATRLVFSCVFCEIMIVPTLRNFEFQLKDLSYIHIVPNYWDIPKKNTNHAKDHPFNKSSTVFPTTSTTNHPMEARAPGEVQLYGGGLGFEVQMVVMVVPVVSP